MISDQNIPVYKQLIQYVEAGFNVLDEETQQQIIIFLETQQHKNGGFTDRGGNPDLYYSIFGFWLCLAGNCTGHLDSFKSYITTQKDNQKIGPVEQMAVILIDTELFKPQKSRSLFSLLKVVFGKGKRIELSYKFFLLTLVIDAQNRYNKVYYFFARIWLYFYKPKGNLPCSLMSALTFAKKKVGLNFKKEQQKLISYYKEGVGFRSFASVTNSDILSTAVALFVLRQTNYDLRLITVDCINFIQHNYSSGAFLSGDGDETRDLEYTFYGLLALGTLIENGEDSEKQT
ncbi:MAG: hypothetical protein L3J54_09760 [Draconibacterium sp.]|nr:hypothetical protein [Draconibacterium sp.]